MKIFKYDVPVIVTLNSFITDTEAEEIHLSRSSAKREAVSSLFQVWEKGGEVESLLLKKVLDTLENKESHFHTLYEDELSLKEKIEKNCN